MQIVSTVVLLTAVVMAQADEMSDVLKLPPHKQHVYIMDVTTEASVDDLKASLVNFTIEDCYKILGEQRYLIVFNSTDTAALDSLGFPAGSEVTQTAVQYGNQHLGMFKAGSGMEEKHTPFRTPDSVIFYSNIRKRHPQMLCSKSYELIVETLTEKFRVIYNTIGQRVYGLIANYPPKFMAFQAIEQNAMQNVMRNLVETTGGQGWHDITTKRVVRVSL